jgi:hypothetical protein
VSTPEGKVKRYVKRRLAEVFDAQPPLKHYEFWPVQSGRGKRTLDLLLCVQGQFFAIETKEFGKTYTELQKDTRDEIHSAGGTVYLVDGPEYCEKAIQDICWRTNVKYYEPR